MKGLIPLHSYGSIILLAISTSSVAGMWIEDRLIHPLLGKSREEERQLLASGLIIMGLLLALFGSRVFRFMQILFGFISAFHFGFYSLATFVQDNPTLWGVCVAMGVVGGAITFRFAKIARAMIGFVTGALFGFIGYITVLRFIPDGSNDPVLYLTITVSCIAGSVIGSRATDKFLIIFIAFVGAFGFAFGIDLLTGQEQLTLNNVKNTQLTLLGWGLIALWASIGSFGTFLQFCGYKKIMQSRAVKKTKELANSSVLLSRSPLISSLVPPTHTVKGRAGLSNLGNTCFMNASLQSLYALPNLRDVAIDVPSRPTSLYSMELSMLDVFSSITKQLCNPVSNAINPSELRVILKKLEFNDGKQHDASEFLRKLINTMIDEVPKGERNIVKEIFGFQTAGVVKCDECQHKSVTKEDSIDLSLEIPSHLTSTTAIGAIVSLEQLINNFFKPIHLQGEDAYQCDACQKRTSAVRTSHLMSLPKCLILTLNRFRFDSLTLKKSKLMIEITISENLIIGNDNYILDSIIVHSGSSSDGGHYYAYSRLPVHSLEYGEERQWFCFDDRSVQSTTFESIQNSFHLLPLASVYTLLYSKQ
eukprot:c21917_g1_i1.p1 GENE.c21917_g1_i1~~c21917_g1_i1.p1  ORF type:complete len:598 (-),score=248.27 c21917_g1_i1:73-1842(-)